MWVRNNDSRWAGPHRVHTHDPGAMQPVNRRRLAHSRKSRMSTNVRNKPYLHLRDQYFERKALISELKLLF